MKKYYVIEYNNNKFTSIHIFKSNKERDKFVFDDKLFIYDFISSEEGIRFIKKYNNFVEHE